MYLGLIYAFEHIFNNTHRITAMSMTRMIISLMNNLQLTVLDVAIGMMVMHLSDNILAHTTQCHQVA